MRKTKVVLLVLCAVLLIVASVVGTLAFLTSQDSVKNTFTIGKVNITVNEAKVDADGQAIESEPRVKENVYHLVPGMEYDKDPTLTVAKGSEESYVRMLVTINCNSALTTLDVGFEDLIPEVNGAWASVGNPKVVGDVATYEFRYKETVKYDEDNDTVLEPLFETIAVPSDLSMDDMETLEGMEITVVGNAIQAAGFDSADDAWAEFKAE